MKLTVLVENEKGCENMKVKAVHGLSFYVEVSGKKIVVDLGSSSRFNKNANLLGLDLSEVDILIISHGHLDHGKGLSSFLKINKRAKIYMHKSSQGQFYTKIFGVIPYYVGLDRSVIHANRDRIVFVENDIQVNENLFIITEFQNDFPQPSANKSLFRKKTGKNGRSSLEQDSFDHEIALLVKESDGNSLISSCSHSGIANILQTSIGRHPGKMKGVIGGFHLYNPITGKREEAGYVSALADELQAFDTQYYTCHCTGKINVKLLKEKLGNKLNTIHTGDSLTL